jgi:S1-C subfamily serine protease
VRTILLDVAGRFHVRTLPKQAEALAALESCEDLRLPLSGSNPKPVARTPLTALEVDQKAARRLVPAWLGFRFMPVAPAVRKRLALPGDAVRVVSVLAKSPAATAGLLRGDILVGAAGEPFTRENPVRPNVVTAPINGEWPLDIQRGRERLTLRLRPQAAPPPTASPSRR